MPRRLPVEIPPSLPARPGSREPLIDLEISVVTPLFGGGATAGQVDPERPVSGQTVRGHLRFWWRACQAPRFSSAEELFESEAAIWGSVGGKDGPGPSKIDLHVETITPGRLENLRERNRRGRPVWRNGYPGYALFPFQESNEKPEADLCLTGVRFRLTLSLARHVRDNERDILQRELESALWAWVTFGGVGARTRRGCGALWVDSAGIRPPEDPERLGNWLRERAAEHVFAGDRTGLHPTLSGARFVVSSHQTSPLRAWNDAIGVMADLRQQPGLGRNPGRENRPGRSRWPEPDTVRELLNLDDQRHAPEHPARPAFPRADLGLPILFQRMADTPALQPAAGSTRLASPVILKPLAIGRDRAVSLVLVLDAPHVWEDGMPELKLGNAPGPITRSMLDVSDRSESIPPLRDLGATSARDAVLALAARRWKTRVERL